MFRIVCDPSSGGTELGLTEITRSGSQIFFVCLVGVWQRNFEPAVCVHGTTGWYSPNGTALQFHSDSAWIRSSKTCMKLTPAECTVENS